MNIQELIAWFELMFECRVGLSGPYADPDKKLQYISFGIRTYISDNAEELLCRELQKDFIPLIHNPLFWRFKDKIVLEHEETQHVGKLLLTREQELDGIAVPAGAVMSWDSMDWFEDLGEDIVTQVYTRLIIPTPLWGQNLFKCIKPEGCVAITLEEL